MTIEKFAAEYNTLMSGSGNRAPLISMEPVKPMPKLKNSADHNTKCWTRDELAQEIQAQGTAKGETDGNASMIRVKAKPGRPPKTSDDDAHSQFYLENSDGTPISKNALQALSQKARGVWETLLANDLAPKTWGKLTSTAWDYYARVMLNEPGLEFLQLCDDGQWKLKEWSQRNYSGWAGNRGIRPKRKKPKSDNDDLSDEKLIQMDPSDEQEDVLDDGSKTEDTPGTVDRAQEEISRPSVVLFSFQSSHSSSLMCLLVHQTWAPRSYKFSYSGPFVMSPQHILCQCAI